MFYFEKKKFPIPYIDNFLSRVRHDHMVTCVYIQIFFSLTYVMCPEPHPNIYSRLYSAKPVRYTALGIGMSYYINVYMLGGKDL